MSGLGVGRRGAEKGRGKGALLYLFIGSREPAFVLREQSMAQRELEAQSG